MIEEVIEDLLLFVEPEIGKELDLGRGFQFMDKELAEMYPEPTKPANTRNGEPTGKGIFCVMERNAGCYCI